MHYAELDSRTLIRLSGDDIIPFLQGLITQDAQKLAKSEALYTALLSPQGKFLHDFFLVPRGDSIWLDVAKTRADDLLNRLKLYKLRSKISIEPLPESYGMVAIWGGASDGITDPRLKEMGQRLYGERDTIRSYAKSIAQAGDYEAHRIKHTIPDGAIDMIFEKSLLLEFGFEDLHGVSFSKGCYVGQEVTARSKYRGQVRKHLARASAAENLPQKGTNIMMNDQMVGELLSVSGTEALAMLRVEAIGSMMKCADISVNFMWPLWLASVPHKEQ